MRHRTGRSILRRAMLVSILILSLGLLAGPAAAQITATPPKTTLTVFETIDIPIANTAGEFLECTPQFTGPGISGGTCTGGSGVTQVTYTAGSQVPTNPVVRLLIADKRFDDPTSTFVTLSSTTVELTITAGISPTNVTIAPGGTQQFQARLPSPPYIFSTTPAGVGSFSPTASSDGLTTYTAPTTAQTVTITATNSAQQSAAATVNVSTARISVGTGSGVPGQSRVTVPVTLENETLTIASFELTVTYDATALTATDATRPQGCGGVSNLELAGRIFVNCATATGARVAAGGVLATLTFNVNATALAAQTPVTMSIARFEIFPGGDTNRQPTSFVPPVTAGSFTVSAGGTIRGTITTSAGRPVAGATITTVPASIQATSGTDGTFSLTGLSPGTFTVRAQAAGFGLGQVTGVRVVAGEPATANITLSALAGIISGTVRNRATGDPIANATVTTDPATQSATTAADGTFTLSNVPAATYTVQASAEGFVTARLADITVASQQTAQANLTLDRATGTISGRVVASDDATAVQGAAVSLDVAGFSATTSAAGSYTIERVPVGSYTVSVTAGNFQAAMQTQVAVMEGATTTVDFSLTRSFPNLPVILEAGWGTSPKDFDLNEGGRLTLQASIIGGEPPLLVEAFTLVPTPFGLTVERAFAQLRDGDGDGIFDAQLSTLPTTLQAGENPLPGFKIVVTDRVGNRSTWPSLNLLERQPPAPMVVQLPAPTIESERPIILRAGWGLSPFTFSLTGGAITLQATVRGGTPPLQVTATAAPGPFATLTDEDGDGVFTAQLTGLPGLSLPASAGEFFPEAMRIDVTDARGQTASWPHLNLFQAPARIVGRVTAGGAPLPGAEVTLENLQGARIDAATTFGSGTYAFETEPGTYRLVVSSRFVVPGTFSAEASAPSGVPKPGLIPFVEVRRDGVQAEAGQTRTVDFVLFPRLPEQPPVLTPLSLTPQSARLTAGGMQTFQAAGGTGTYRWEVTSGDLSSLTGPSTVLTAPGVAGTHFVILSDTAGGIVTAKVEVSRPLVLTPASATLPFAGTATFTAIGGSPPYTWSAGTGTVEPTSGTETTYTAAGVAGRDSVRLRDSSGSEVMAAINVTQPLALTPQTANVQPRATATFTASGGTGTYFYTASAGQVSPITGETTTFTAPAQISNQTVIVTDSAGNSAFGQVSVASGTIRVSPAVLRLDLGGSGELRALSGTPPYTWTAERGELSATTSAENVAITYTAPSLAGVFNVGVADNAGNQAIININVNSRIRISPAQAVVATNDTASFFAAGGSGSFVWSATAGSVSPTTGARITYTAPTVTGTANLVVTDTAGSTGVAVVTVSEVPRPTPRRATLAAGETVRFNVAGGVSPYSWQADAGNLSATAGATVQHTAASLRGSYFVTVTDAAGNSAQTEVEVLGNAQVSITTANDANSFTGGDFLRVNLQVSGEGVVDVYAAIIFPDNFFALFTDVNVAGEIGVLSVYRGGGTLLNPAGVSLPVIAIPLPAPLPVRGQFNVVSVITPPGTDPLVRANQLAVASRVITLQ
ncbi:MAG: carboxypeptidase regulatory-like domain-containing protein [Candidatus Tectomicrobia bacterium]|nr:carboxypeptidase regulatory-like domain-containing protein [Candidatus Tectomicrobia bacterium]